MRGKRFISSILSMAMVFTLNAGMSFAEETPAPVTEEPVVEEQMTDVPEETPAVEEESVSEEVPVIEEQPIEQEPEVEQQEEKQDENEYPAQTFTGTTPDGKISVEVRAGEGALPKDVSMRVENVNTDAIKGLVESVIDGQADTMSAVNVIFTDVDGHEVEPLAEIIVNIKMAGVEASDTYQLVHIDQANNPEKIADEKIVSISNTEATFASDVFSVYVVVGGESTDSDARLTVKFYRDSATEIATMYAKNSDTLAELETILYDPGIGGDVPSGKVFKGWSIGVADYDASTTSYTIEQVRQYVEGLTIKEGDELKLYAMFLNSYTVTYVDEKGVVIGGSSVLGVEAELPYTVDQSYTPADNVHDFQGWIPSSSTKSNIVSPVQDSYENKTQITIKGDVLFDVKAPQGNWLVFHENGGTYRAPIFVVDGDNVPSQPAAPQRAGYTFGGWYTDEAFTNEFTGWNAPLSEKTDIYAKWDLNDSANYSVIIWLERIDATEGYDYEDTIRLSGTPETTITSVKGDSGDESVQIDGSSYSYEGFSLDRYDTNVVIDPAGGTVLNVYFKRNTYTLSFERYYRGSWTEIDAITAKYEENIADEWPIVDRISSRVYDQGERWDPQTNPFGWDEVMVFLDVMPSSDVTFRLDEADRTTLTMNLYVEALPNETGTTVDGPNVIYNYSTETENRSWAGKKFVLYKSVNADYTGFTIEDFVELSGFERIGADHARGNRSPRYYGMSNNTVNFYYSRNTNVINFMDGTYFRSASGGDIPLSVTDRGQLDVSDPILYDNDVSSYNKGGADYYAPTYPEYTFAGWYIDKDCTQPYTFSKMPKGGITVYAKWMINQYRVFLHPNAGTDPTLDWGTEPTMSFRVSSGDKISTLTGTRAQYEMVGWYSNEGLTDVFDGDLVVINDSTATTPYDGATEYSDTYDKYGNLIEPKEYKDADRFWITKRVDLYLKWRAKLPGADGINVVYDPNGGSGEPTDERLYQDSTLAIAQPAVETAPDKKLFEYWVVQKWNGSSYEDTDVTVYPGNTFEVLKANAKDVDNGDGTHTYTVQLKAVYRDTGEETPTHINWYGNGGTTSDGKTVIEHTGLKINEAIDIEGADTFKKEGYRFVGWERVEEKGSPTGTTDNLFLKYDYQQKKFFAKDSSGNFTVEATQVAADERLPYHDLYAVWESVIYVWHSSTAVKEEIAMSDLEKAGYKLDIISKVNTADYYYGGWYTKYNGDETKPYNAFAGDRAGEWKYAEASAVDGSAITIDPATDAGKTYYLKEVPKAYLSNYSEMIYKLDGEKIVNLFQMSAVDDLNYTETGFVVKKAENKATVVRTFTFKQHSGKTTMRRADLIFSGVSNPSYLTYLDMGKLGLVTENSSFTVTPYWKTKDGKTITGKTRSIELNDLTITNFKKQD